MPKRNKKEETKDKVKGILRKKNPAKDRQRLVKRVRFQELDARNLKRLKLIRDALRAAKFESTELMRADEAKERLLWRQQRAIAKAAEELASTVIQSEQSSGYLAHLYHGLRRFFFGS